MVVANLKTLSPELAKRWGLDGDVLRAHAAEARALPDMSGIWPAVFERPAEPARDVDEDLYGGFVDDHDRRRLNDLRTLSPEKLAQVRSSFDDSRLDELLFRYRARNFPASLSPEEQQRWEEHRAARLFDGEGGARTIDSLFSEIDALSETADERGEEILGALYDYAEAIAPERD
jgi:exodeoxyribonuclease-1